VAKEKNDFFTKKSSKNCPSGGAGDILFRNRVRNTIPCWKSVFDQTFVKSLVKRLRVRNALRVGLAIYFFVNGNGA
jgi:hypothetical protein